MNFIERLFNSWLDYKREKRICQNCEFLKIQLEANRLEREKLIDRLTESERKVETVIPEVTVQPISGKRHIPFRVRQQMLETEQLHAIQALKKRQQEIRDTKLAGMNGGVNGEKSSLEVLEDEVLSVELPNNGTI